MTRPPRPSPLYSADRRCFAGRSCTARLPLQARGTRESARRRRATSSPPATPRTSTPGRSGSRSGRAASCASWRSRSSSGSRSARSSRRCGAFKVRRGQADRGGDRDGGRARTRRARRSRCSRRGPAVRRASARREVAAGAHRGGAHRPRGRASRSSPPAIKGTDDLRAARAAGASPTARRSRSTTSHELDRGRGRADRTERLMAAIHELEGVAVSGRCSRSTATRSPIAPTTRCRSRSAARTAGERPRRLRELPAAAVGRGAAGAVLVGWDSLDEPTYRHEALPAYQSGRVFEDAILEQLDAAARARRVVRLRCRRRRAGYEADDFLAAAAADAGPAPCSSPPPTATPSSSSATASRSCSRSRACRSSRGSGRPRCASATASSRRRCPTSSRCAATPPTASRARRASARRRRPTCSRSTARSRPLLAAGRFSADRRRPAALPADRDDGRRGAAARARRPAARLGARRPKPRDASSA